MSDPDQVGHPLVEQICALFEQVNVGKNDGRTWLEVWTTGLNTEALGPTGVYEALHQISKALDRLSSQIETSQQSDRAKTIGRSVIKGLRDCIAPSALPQPCVGLKDRFTADKLNTLRMAGDRVQFEAPEPLIPKAKYDEIGNTIKELEVLLNDAAFPPKLKSLLLPHVQYLKWAIQNYNVFGIDGLLKATVNASIFLRRVQVPADEIVEKTLVEKMKKAIGRVAEIVKTADAAIRVGKEGYFLANSASNAVSTILD